MHAALVSASLAPASQLRDTAWPQLAFDPAEAIEADGGMGNVGSPAMDAYQVLSRAVDGADVVSLWEGNGAGDEVGFKQQAQPATTSGLPHPHTTLPLDAIHFVDNAQALSHVLTYLQAASPAYVGVDLEWTDPSPVSLVQIATSSRVFVLDTVGKTPLYMSVLDCLLDWLLKKEEITKLFFGFPQDLIRLNMLFEQQGRTFRAFQRLASIVDLYVQRIRREKVWAPRDEETPLGREHLLGAALDAGDLAEVQRLSAKLPPHPPVEILSERTFLIGSHQSLSAMADRFLGVKLEKSLRRSNWNFRPLSSAQVVYAAMDAHVLLRLEAALRDKGLQPQRALGVGPRTALQPAWWRTTPTDSAG